MYVYPEHHRNASNHRSPFLFVGLCLPIQLGLIYVHYIFTIYPFKLVKSAARPIVWRLSTSMILIGCLFSDMFASQAQVRAANI